uniref:BZIP domain-containing protein n=1 Tax=Parastrongyloides trichosuri TaxID=131310 RepID=A0A0N4ZQ56_PARTI
MTSNQKRKYSFAPNEEKESEIYKKRREANKAAVDKHRRKEREEKEVQQKNFNDKMKLLEDKINQYEVNRQIDINMIRTEFNEQIDKINNQWQQNYNTLYTTMLRNQLENSTQISYLTSTIENLSNILMGNNCNYNKHINNTINNQEVVNEEFKVSDYNSNPSIKSINSGEYLESYDEEYVPPNIVFTTEGGINYNNENTDNNDSPLINSIDNLNFIEGVSNVQDIVIYTGDLT